MEVIEVIEEEVSGYTEGTRIISDQAQWDQDACKVKNSLKASMLLRDPEANQALALACF